jgi:hypothetical protein
LIAANTVTMSGRLCIVYPKLAYAASQIGGKALKYFTMFSHTGTRAIQSAQPPSCTRHCTMRILQRTAHI